MSKLPRPNNKKDVHNFQGHVGCYCRFIENFTKLPSPLFTLLKYDRKFYCTNQCLIALEDLKENLSVESVLRGPDWSLPFHFSTDASKKSIGVVLGQK